MIDHDSTLLSQVIKIKFANVLTVGSLIVGSVGRAREHVLGVESYIIRLRIFH